MDAGLRDGAAEVIVRADGSRDLVAERTGSFGASTCHFEFGLFVLLDAKRRSSRDVFPINQIRGRMAPDPRRQEEQSRRRNPPYESAVNVFSNAVSSRGLMRRILNFWPANGDVNGASYRALDTQNLNFTVWPGR